MKYLYPLLLGIPVAIWAELSHGSPLLIFVASSLAIIPLAGIMGKATEEVALHAGPRIGGLLNATMGNAAELIITIFALRAGLFEVVKASIAGSIIGNILLVLGLSALLGGLKFKAQRFNPHVAAMNATMLFLAVIALVIPDIFALGGKLTPAGENLLSLGEAIVLVSVYLLSLLFSFGTHKELFHTAHNHIEKAEWTLGKALGILVAATVAVGLMSEFLVGSVEHVVEQVGLSEAFIGVILIPLIGNAAEHSSAVIMALKNRMDLALEIAVGSSTQVALLVAPVLIFVSYLFGKPMNMVFNLYELAAVAVAVLITNLIANDGETNWLEGAMLVATYGILGLAFYVL